MPLHATDVSLNVPYDSAFQPLYLAYIVGLVEFGLNPVATVAVPGGKGRLAKIQRLIRESQYSVHDLSRVEVSVSRPVTPRFNMPFELGLAVAWAEDHPSEHIYFAFEAKLRRGAKSLSDLAQTDFYIHGNSPKGVMRELCSAFSRPSPRPTVPSMLRHHRLLTAKVPLLRRENGANDLYNARMFADLVVLAKKIIEND